MFVKAKPIWAKNRKLEMNNTCYFVSKFSGKNVSLKLTASTIYRVFLNGDLVAYGPARAAHNYFRVDEIKLNSKETDNVLVVEVNGYNCNNYYYPNQSSFLVAEVYSRETVLSYTGNDFKCIENTSRIQKVVRFSYQRGFSESYKKDTNPIDFYLTGNCDFPTCDLEVFEHKNYIDRRIGFPTFDIEEFLKVENGTFIYNENIEPYRDRYMVNEYLSIFDFNNLDINVNDIVSRYEYKKGLVNQRNVIQPNEFMTYKTDVSYTGFIGLDIEVLEDAEVYVIFDEYNANQDNDGLIDIKFYRNTTHNVLSYTLKKGVYNLLSFEAYTAQFLRVLVARGSVRINDISIIKYENSKTNNFKFDSDNEKINGIMRAAINTFAQNAVDILTDCPSRERAGWLCDSYFLAKAEKMITGINEIEYNFLENYALAPQLEHLPNNMIPMCYPAEFPNNEYIPNWSLFYIIELYDYLLRTGDSKLVDKSFDKAKGLIEYFKKYENENNLLEDLEGWIMIEWSHANDAEFIKGVNYPSNMLYSKALWCYGKLYNDISSVEKSDKIAAIIRQDSFNGMFFEDNRIRKNSKLVQTGNISEVCQYYALYFGIANKELYPDFHNRIVNDFRPARDYNTVHKNVHKANVFIGNYLRLGYFLREGMYSEVLNESVDYFYQMSVITGTLWEHDDTQASLNHGFASYVLNMIVESLTGYISTDHIKKEVCFKDVSSLVDFEINIPVFDGIIKMKNIQGKIDVTLPNGYKEVKVKNKY